MSGRGAGVGRGRGVGCSLGVGVGLIVAVGVAVGVPDADAVAVAVFSAGLVVAIAVARREPEAGERTVGDPSARIPKLPQARPRARSQLSTRSPLLSAAPALPWRAKRRTPACVGS